MRTLQLLRVGSLVLVLPVSLVAQGSATLAEHRFDADLQHSSIEFTARILRIVKVRGRFHDWSATVVYDPERPERSSVTAVIATKSIDTDMSFRDDHVRSPDFLDVATYPTIVFQSDSVVPTASGVLRTVGHLSMHGVTRRVVIPFTLVLAPATDTSSGSARVAFEGAISLSRADFGIAGTNKFNPSYDPATNLLADSVDVSLEVLAIREGYLQGGYSHGPPPPIADRVWSSINTSGVDSALALYRALLSRDSTAYNFGARQLDVLGHRLLQLHRPREAVKLLLANAERFQQAGEYESLGEAYAFAGDASRALECYRRAAVLDPQDATAMEMVRRLSAAPQR
ncbi:MAG TPA: YceI family protein [Gemmatimonadales bacterium]|nr:YceI family protein [Gemmatimonadales bacterium]